MEQLFKDAPWLVPWIFPASVVAITALVDRLIQRIVRLRLRRIDPERHVWLHAVLSALGAPLRALLWITAAALIKYHFLPSDGGSPIDRIVVHGISVLSTLTIAWFLARIVVRAKDNYTSSVEARRGAIDETAVDALGKLVFMLITVFASISVLQQIGVSLASLLAFGGAAGIAVGFAAQTLVANLFGGLTIYASRIFKIGEDIIIPDTTVQGTVRHIGWRATLVMGWNGQPVYVPNAIFNKSNVINYSRMQWRMISQHILLQYRDLDKAEAVIADANEFLATRKELSYVVFRLDGYGETAIKLYLNANVQTTDGGGYVPYADFMRIKEELLLHIANIAASHGCNLTLPSYDVHLTPPVVKPSASSVTDGRHDDVRPKVVLR